MINLHSNMVRFIIDLSQEHIFTAEDLHSNMVRFIIINPSFTNYEVKFIYIPIWLDLL